MKVETTTFDLAQKHTSRYKTSSRTGRTARGEPLRKRPEPGPVIRAESAKNQSALFPLPDHWPNFSPLIHSPINGRFKFLIERLTMKYHPPFTCIFWIDDPSSEKKSTFGQVPRSGVIPVSRVFSSATEGMDWIIATAKAHADFTGEMEIFDSFGSCLYSDMLCPYVPEKAAEPAS